MRFKLTTPDGREASFQAGDVVARRAAVQELGLRPGDTATLTMVEMSEGQFDTLAAAAPHDPVDAARAEAVARLRGALAAEVQPAEVEDQHVRVSIEDVMTVGAMAGRMVGALAVAATFGVHGQPDGFTSVPVDTLGPVLALARLEVET